MSDAMGRMYSERYFPAEQKARVQAMWPTSPLHSCNGLKRQPGCRPPQKTQALVKN
jgi:hypothetical protein